MGVEIMSQKNLANTALALKCHLQTVNIGSKLDEAGVTCKAGMDGVSFYDKDQTLIHTFGIGMASWLKCVNQAKDGDHVAPAVLSLVSKMFVDALNFVYEKISHKVVDLTEHPQLSEPTILTEHPQLSEPTIKDFEAFQTELKEQTVVLKVKAVAPNTGEPVHLIDATAIGQPVFGTDSGSRYYVVARADGMNVAVRIKSNGTISVRCEGKNLGDYKAKLVKCGINPASPIHCSVHMECGSPELAAKTVGAILFGTHIEFIEMMSDVSVIVGKGK